MLLQCVYNQIVTQSLCSRGLLSEKSNTFGLVFSPSQIPPQPTSYIFLLENLYLLTWNQYVTELSQVKDAPQSPLPWGSKKYQ